ncbi:MAG: arginase [Alphaproteobacteria bacterium]
MNKSDRHIAIIGAASGWGAQIRTTEDAPQFLDNKGFSGRFSNVNSMQVVHPKIPSSQGENISPADALPHVVDVASLVFKEVSDFVSNKKFPLVIGGDHSIAVGTWSALVQSLNAAGEFGLIWFDAHMDAHTPDTSPSNAYHGMPVAALLGEGEARLTGMGAPNTKLRPEHVVLIGIRDYEPGESERLERLGVRVIKMDEIAERGVEECFDEAIKIASSAPKGFGISVDMDGFDPESAPGVGSPVPGGLLPKDVLPCFKKIGSAPTLRGVEITEFNPHLDKDDKTSALVIDVAAAFLE